MERRFNFKIHTNLCLSDYAKDIRTVEGQQLYYRKTENEKGG